MPIYYYTWTASLEEETISFRILESSEEDARRELIQNIEKFQTFHKSYNKFERQLQVNKDNKKFVEKKALAAYAKGDVPLAESLEAAIQTIHNSNRRLRQEMEQFLDNLDIDTRGMISEQSPFSVHLEAIVRTATGEEIPLQHFLMTSPTVTPAIKIEIFHNT